MDESQHLLWSCLDFINLGLSLNPVLSLFFKNDLTRRIVAKSELRLLLWKQLTLFLLTIFSNFIFGLRTTTSTGNSLVFFMWSNQTFIPPKRIHLTQIKVQEIQVSHYLYSNLQNPTEFCWFWKKERQKVSLMVLYILVIWFLQL